MAKQKEIKFRRDGKLFYGQQNGVKYSIHEARRLHEDESEQYYVSVNYPNERHRSFTTNGYRTFDLDGAKAFCQQVGILEGAARGGQILKAEDDLSALMVRTQPGQQAAGQIAQMQPPAGAGGKAPGHSAHRPSFHSPSTGWEMGVL